MLSEYQLKIVDFYNIPIIIPIDGLYNVSIGNVKQLVPNFFDKEKYVLYYENLQIYL